MKFQLKFGEFFLNFLLIGFLISCFRNIFYNYWVKKSSFEINNYNGTGRIRVKKLLSLSNSDNLNFCRVQSRRKQSEKLIRGIQSGSPVSRSPHVFILRGIERKKCIACSLDRYLPSKFVTTFSRMFAVIRLLQRSFDAFRVSCFSSTVPSFISLPLFSLTLPSTFLPSTPASFVINTIRR